MKPIDKRKKYGESYALWLRNYQRARSRVLTRLAQENPDRYKELLEEERARDEAQGKTWIDLSGRTSSSLGSSSSPDRGSKTKVGQTNRDNEEDSDLGGEA